jgi:endonuclease/exonuclease/phosphatase (EEP) superfamily protein YafD
MESRRPRVLSSAQALPVLAAVTLTLSLVLLATLRHVGEANHGLALLLFVPPTFWLLPGLLLLPFALVRSWRSLPLLAAAAWVILGPFMGWQKGRGAPQPADYAAPSLTLMTWNRGQHGGQSPIDFKRRQQPDLFLLQESALRERSLARSNDYGEYIAHQSIGEHTLLSKFPILEGTLLPAGATPREARAARFVVDWNGRRIAVYSVHLRTPRDVLLSQWRGGLVYGLLGFPGTAWAERSAQNQIFWDGQLADAGMILDAVRQDPLPALVAGDFNSPHTGLIRQRLARELGDAHAEAGSGFGFTFPGKTRNPFSGGGPWLRIDYIFFSRQWSAMTCTTEAERASQHRAVAARLALTRS